MRVVPDWLLGRYEVSPLVVGALVATVVVASLVYAVWSGLGRR